MGNREWFSYYTCFIGGQWILGMYLLLTLLLLYTASSFRVNEWKPSKRQVTSLKANAENKLVIGTRGSPLALAQAYETKRLLINAFPRDFLDEISIQKIMTKGDSILNQALSEIGGKGLFTKELDTALLDGSVDVCVHSMKDVPTVLPEGTELYCMLQREQTNDVFISKKYKTLKDIPDGAVIGSASLRRQAQLLAMNPTWKVINFRGNVQTRLKKIENGVVDGTLLALAGLRRLNMQQVIEDSYLVSWDEMLPAVAQGAIGIQCRSDDERVKSLLACINHLPTLVAVECERAFLGRLDGNCRTPIAGQAYFDPNSNRLNFRGMLSKPDGRDPLVVERSGFVESVQEARELGVKAGNEIRNMAGDKFEEYQHAMQAMAAA